MRTILLKCSLDVDTLLTRLDVDTGVDNERLWSVSYLVIFRRERGMFRHWCWHCSAPLHAVTSGHWSGKYFRPWLSEIFQHPTWQCLLFIPLHWLVVSQFFWLWLTVICSAGLTPHNAPPTTVLIVAVAPLSCLGFEAWFLSPLVVTGMERLALTWDAPSSPTEALEESPL